MNKKYGVIVADPPWKFSDKLTFKNQGEVRRGADYKYPTLNLHEIKHLHVADLAADNSICALWVPAAFLKVGIDVLEAWGFEYKQLWTWVKTSKRDATKLSFGMGRLARNCHEPILVGTKGKYTKHLQNHSQRNVFLAPQASHSQKPETIQDALDLMFPNWNKLELFARRERQGWTCIGNESPYSMGYDIRDSIKALKK